MFREDFTLNKWAMNRFGVTLLGPVVITGVTDKDGETLGLEPVDVLILSDWKIDPTTD